MDAAGTVESVGPDVDRLAVRWRWCGAGTNQRPERGIQIRQVWVREVLERSGWLQRLRALASEGKLRLRVAAEYPPEQAGEAQSVTEAGGLRGRVLIVF